MFDTILFVIWFFAPAGIANMVPILAAKAPLLKKYSYPLDFNKTFRGKRILGDHKTIRGILTGVVFGVGVVLLQQYLYGESETIRDIVSIDYNDINPFILGTLLSLGALLGDATRSFFKRRVGIKPGGTWFPFDQLDYIVGGIVFTMPYVALTLEEYMILIITWFILHPASTITAYLIGMKEKPI